MDTMYFAHDMVKFVHQIFEWLKKDGVFFAGYQEGDVMPKTDNCDTTALALAFQNNGINYTAEDITEETYLLLRKKRSSAEKLKKLFEQENLLEWYSMIIGQTESAVNSLEEYRKNNARYLYKVRK